MRRIVCPLQGTASIQRIDVPSGISRGTDVLRVRIMRRAHSIHRVWQEPRWRPLSSPPHHHLRAVATILDFWSSKRNLRGESAPGYGRRRVAWVDIRGRALYGVSHPARQHCILRA